MACRLFSNRLRVDRIVPGKSRPKAFKSEESANKWAKANNIKNYTLRNLRKEGDKKKIKIVVK
ncbi:hypothetical protein CMO83_04755 [Candidatus Woesearchaeota archaeon]|jgi:hypothetical protein|nr:hypothetical protein [Candidatus Woesearchaeota archaeon]MDP6648223.1 hypothetical protein [Candidatus Woesearchaeota archaeon]|tara:strand:- start:21744 stop:21932 length:189 start_codon:yes stop_codon:yes gene_type:complete